MPAVHMCFRGRAGKAGQISFPEISGRLSWIYVQIKVRDGLAPSLEILLNCTHATGERGREGAAGPFPLISQQPAGTGCCAPY